MCAPNPQRARTEQPTEHTLHNVNGAEVQTETHAATQPRSVLRLWLNTHKDKDKWKPTHTHTHKQNVKTSFGLFVKYSRSLFKLFCFTLLCQTPEHFLTNGRRRESVSPAFIPLCYKTQQPNVNCVCFAHVYVQLAFIGKYITEDHDYKSSR